MMSTVGATLVDGSRLAQAREALSREMPTPSDGAKFQWLIWSVWAAIALGVAWIPILLVWPNAQWPVLMAALASSVTSAVLVVANAPYLFKLFAAHRMARQLDLSPRPAASGTSRRYLATLSSALGLIGYPLAMLSAVLIVAGVSTGNSTTVPIASVLFLFSVACVLIRPVTKLEQRLEAIAVLNAALGRQSDGITSADLEPAIYDEVTHVERVQIEIERHRSVPTARSDRGVAVRVSQRFHDATTALPADEAALVFRLVHTLARSTHGRDPLPGSEKGSSSVTVPDTPYALECHWDPERHEIRILDLRARGIGERHDV